MEQLKKQNTLIFCNFCGKSAVELINEKIPLKRSHEFKSAICDLCLVTLHHDCDKKIIKEFAVPTKSLASEVVPSRPKLYTPVEILKLLNKHVMGQEDAKKAIALAVSNHLRGSEVKQKKSNVLLLGPSGTGKTEMARALCQELDIPLYMHDATNLTTSGYVGKDVETILLNLLASCKNDVAKAETAIVVIDEIDKKADRGPNSGDIGTNMVQDALLKMIEGDKFIFNFKEKRIVIDTSKILFICAGAFSGIKLENTQKRSIGMSEGESLKKTDINMRDALQAYGLKPEFIRRFSIITKTIPHTEESLSMIFNGKENSILARFKDLYSSYGLELHVDEKLKKSIITNALKSPLPVSEIEQSLENFSQKVFFDPNIESKFKVTLTTDGHIFNKKKKV